MSFDFSIPSQDGQTAFSIEPGSSVVFVGANGGGKSRLAVLIESSLQIHAHRISAHRALALNPDVPKISERQALDGLKFGYAKENAQLAHRDGQRWQNHPAVALLNDFGFLLQVMFAEQANTSLATHQRVRAGVDGPTLPTKFEQLMEIWDRLLPHRQLHVSGDNIEVSANGLEKYKASEMSDGERAIFYMIAQTLSAEKDSLLIVDEPELHVHRSIMAKLWDELAAVRPDCAIVFITHDLEFAASRVAQKFSIRDYIPTPRWTIEAVPENSGFDEELTTLILGSRRPILFVEGDENSLDAAIYRCCYPSWTVVPRGSCEEVIHSVVTMRRNNELTRVTCSGIVDADDYSADDIAYLDRLGVKVLAVSEIENLILLPAVSRAIAESHGYDGPELESRLGELKEAVFATLDSDVAIDKVVTRYCRRRIDRLLKKVDLSEAGTVAEISEEYRRQTAELDIGDIAEKATLRIQQAVREQDLVRLLANYDNKALVNAAASHLKQSRLVDFESWLMRVLRNNKVPALLAALRVSLPEIQAR